MTNCSNFRATCPKCYEEIEMQLRLTEANQAKPESGTTACSDAGGVVEQVKTAGSADREPGLAEELKKHIEKRIERLTCLNTDGTCEPQKSIIEELRAICVVVDLIEARR